MEQNEVVSSVASQISTSIEKAILSGENSVDLQTVIKEVTGKSIRELEKESGLVSMHSTVFLKNVGQEVSKLLNSKLENKKVRCISHWGSSTYLDITDL